MRFPAFEEAVHRDHGARYAIDWKDGERIYKEPTPGIRIYENNSVAVLTNGAGKPRWRKEVKYLYGLDFRSTKDFPGMEFFTPEGVRVPKKHLEIKGPLLYMPEYGRVYHISISRKGRGPRGVRFLHPNAQPVPYNHVTAYARNAAEEQRRMDALKPYIDLGTTLQALDPLDQYMHWRDADALRANKLPKDMTSSDARRFCRVVASYLDKTYRVVQQAARDKCEFDYLIVKEK